MRTHVRHRRPGEAPRTQATELGTAMVGTVAGVLVFMVFLLFAVQLTVNLYETSVVTAVGLDAARSVASRTVNHDDPAAVARARARAEATARSLLGQRGRRIDMTWSLDRDEVRLRVQVRAARFLPTAMDRAAGLDAVDRTFVARVERVR